MDVRKFLDEASAEEIVGKIDELSRQGFLGEKSDQVLSQCRVAIIGLDGGGSHIAQQLAHLGVGNFVLFDPDRVEENQFESSRRSDEERRSNPKTKNYRFESTH